MPTGILHPTERLELSRFRGFRPQSWSLLKHSGPRGVLLRARGVRGALVLTHCPGLGGSPLLRALVLGPKNCERAVEFGVSSLAVSETETGALSSSS